jgi:hypothetical protein
MPSISANSPVRGRKPGWLLAGAVLAIILAATMGAAGCKKSEPAPTPPAAPPPADTNAAPAAASPAPPAAAAPVVVASNPDGGADLKQLNHAYVGWVMQNRRRPQSFEEFVRLSGIQVPPPPAGKKYVIDGHGFINYANN